MKRTSWTLLMLALVAGAAHADPSNLAGGVLLAHHVPELPYSTDPPPGTGDWCAEYDLYAIGSISEVIAQIDVTAYAPVVWYVIAAWPSEDKEWCGTEFGLADYDGYAFSFVEAFPCFPDEGLEIPTADWPGPLEGTAFVTTTAPWMGNWVPVYFFGGYAYAYYGPQVMAIDVDPPTGFCGFGNCLAPPTQYEVDPMLRGAMGINTPGHIPQLPELGACCYEYGECQVLLEWECDELGGYLWLPGVPCDPNPCPPPPLGACCFVGMCEVLLEEDCVLQGGQWLGGGTGCEPNPCEAVCCTDPAQQYHVCIITLEDDCAAQGGYWHPEEGSCDPNPCTIYTPADETSWGRIKGMYR